MKMEGTLKKWTNYWNGWQPRWFILHNGILEYYHSSQDVQQGCKGSLKLSACDIIVHLTDDTRLDIAVSAQQYFYLRAFNNQDRQKWLIALGTAKAATCAAEQGNLFSNKTSTYKSRLQEHSKTILNKVEDLNISTNSDDSLTLEAADSLKNSCDNLIHTLEECMYSVQGDYSTPLTPVSSTIKEIIPVHNSNIYNKEFHKENSYPVKKPNIFAYKEPDNNNKIEMSNAMDTNIQERHVDTFFSKMNCSFKDVQIKEDKLIPTEMFLKATNSVISIFDCIGPTLFKPVKSDMEGNVKKIREKFQRNRKHCKSLQEMVLHDLETKNLLATEALLWSKRSLEFMLAFLTEYLEGNEYLSQCASEAYSKTLKHHHGYVVRGLFSLIARGLPSKDSFLNSLAPTPDDRKHSDFEAQLKRDLKDYVESLSKVVSILSEFYISHNLEKKLAA